MKLPGLVSEATKIQGEPENLGCEVLDVQDMESQWTHFWDPC